MYLWTCWSLVCKRAWIQIATPQNTELQITKQYSVRKSQVHKLICRRSTNLTDDLWFAELICWPPSFVGFSMAAKISCPNCELWSKSSCQFFFVEDPSGQFRFELSFLYLIFVKYNPALLSHIFFCFSPDSTVSIQMSVISDPGLIPM